MQKQSDNRLAHPPAERPAGEELLVHFWFTEQETPGFKVLAFFTIFWFAGVFALARWGGLFEYVREYPFWLRVAMGFFTGIPLVLMVYVTVRFFWWVAPALASFSEWGRGRRWARHLWFWLLVLGSFIALDPFDLILDKLALVEKAELAGIGSFNPLQALYWGLVILVLILLCWYHLKLATDTGWRKLREWWEYAVSLPLGLRISLTHMFRPNFTFYYPEQTRDDIPDYFRGRQVLRFDEQGEHLCIVDRACERICPDRLINISSTRNPETKKQELTGFLVDNSRCCFCGLCEDVCPTGALRLTSEYAYSVCDRGDLIVDLYGEYLERSRPLRERRPREAAESATVASGSAVSGVSGGER